jgi:hypothetical protein
MCLAGEGQDSVREEIGPGACDAWPFNAADIAGRASGVGFLVNHGGTVASLARPDFGGGCCKHPRGSSAQSAAYYADGADCSRLIRSPLGMSYSNEEEADVKQYMA